MRIAISSIISSMEYDLPQIPVRINVTNCPGSMIFGSGSL
jgi:hypothetical protein